MDERTDLTLLTDGAGKLRGLSKVTRDITERWPHRLKDETDIDVTIKDIRPAEDVPAMLETVASIRDGMENIGRAHQGL